MMWIARFYVATRFDPMTERTLTFDRRLAKSAVVQLVDARLARLRANGQAIHPRYDLQQERQA